MGTQGLFVETYRERRAARLVFVGTGEEGIRDRTLRTWINVLVSPELTYAQIKAILKDEHSIDRWYHSFPIDGRVLLNTKEQP